MSKRFTIALDVDVYVVDDVMMMMMMMSLSLSVRNTYTTVFMYRALLPIIATSNRVLPIERTERAIGHPRRCEADYMSARARIHDSTGNKIREQR